MEGKFRGRAAICGWCLGLRVLKGKSDRVEGEDEGEEVEVCVAWSKVVV